jgi:flagellar basal-body rod modification protein FlgD
VTVNGTSMFTGAATDTKTSDTPAARETRLGQDAFMKLLTTQLANQDPLAPQENGEFLAQLAQFSSLEKLTAIETSIKELAAAFATLAGTPQTQTPTQTETPTQTGN